MFGRIRSWLRRHETLVDALWVVPLLLLCLAGIPEADRTGGVPVPVDVALVSGLLLPLVVRRRFPVGVFAAAVPVAALRSVLGAGGLFLGGFAVIVSMYTVAAYCRPRWALAALATAELGLLAMIAHSPYTDWGDWNAFASYTFLIMLCWVTGLYTNIRRSYLLGLEERAEWLERAREDRTRAAIAEERARIARELHDVVAHNVSVIVVQADGAAYTIGSDPERARGALETISETGRTALAEMRGILGVLRDGGDEEGYAPRPGLEQLDQLAVQARRAGLPVEFTVSGTARPVPAGVGLAGYRVVQEALTNTLRHAGPAVSRVRVELHHEDDALRIRVLDDGRGTAAPTTGEAADEGYGLIGMRERVSAYDGSLRAGPHPDGGYEVVATLPLRSATASSA
ncbi:sensor histidine kinase [Nocardiopsis terrae]